MAVELPGLGSGELVDDVDLTRGELGAQHLSAVGDHRVDEAGRWRAVLTPVYVFPLMDEQGRIIGWERRVYDDEVTLIQRPPVP